MEYKLLKMVDLLNIGYEDLPLAVLTENKAGFWKIVSKAIKHFSPHGFGAHFMWMHTPCYFASQDFWLDEKHVSCYYDAEMLFYKPIGTTSTRKMATIGQINRDLGLSRKERAPKKGREYREVEDPDKESFSYDVLQIVGYATGNENFQDPKRRVCSDMFARYAHFLHPGLLPQNHRMKPSQVDIHCSLHPDHWEVYGRYLPKG
jgi:hypothetical protein